VLLGQEKEKKLDACSLLSAADAASITGTPMWFVHGGRGSCEYIDRKPAVLSDTKFERAVILEMKRYKNTQVGDKEWAKATAVRGQVKEDIQLLNGIGDEAYLFGHIQDGKIGISQIYVRKGTLIVRLQNLDYFSHGSSPDALIAVARKITDQL
jgi:hypothetical protein